MNYSKSLDLAEKASLFLTQQDYLLKEVIYERELVICPSSVTTR